jgi:hypothetical protein
MSVNEDMGREATHPRPARRSGTLVESVAPGITVAVPGNGGGDWPWGNGVKIVGEDCNLTDAIPMECDELDADDPTEGYGDVVTFSPFAVQVARSCGVMSGIGGQLSDDARRRLNEAIGFRLARELYTGEITSNPAITVDPTVIAVSEALPVCQAVALMIEHIAELYGNLAATLHVTPAALEILASEVCVVREGNQFFTHTGHLVIGDAGYDGRAPTADGYALTDPADGEEYVYATGPVAWEYGPAEAFDLTDLGSTTDGRQNRLAALARQPVVAVFDPSCVHLAVLAKLCGCC